MTKIVRVIGIDPGFGRTGIGMIDVCGNSVTHVHHEVIETSAEHSFSQRLQETRDAIVKNIQTFQPTLAVVETLFFQTNVRTAMKVGMARGVVLLTIADAALQLIELSPGQVKQGITGYGNADKKQVELMVTRLLKLERAPKFDDAADALAIAIVGGLSARSLHVGR